MHSNRETGRGRSDILVERSDRKCGFIVELKSVKKESALEAACQAGLAQIEAKDYAAALRRSRIMNVRRSVIGALEEGEEPQEYEEWEKTDAEWILEHWDQCLRLPDEFDEYQEMENFIDALPTPYQEPLERAICGKGAFRRFRETAARLKVLDHWYAYREAAYRREAREWCDANGIAWWERAWEDRA